MSVVEYEDNVDEQLRTIGDRLPKPVGYKMLLALPEAKETTEAGLFIPDERRTSETTASILGCVIAQGSSCYKDAEKFPDGAWCKVGDWVMMKSYSGTRFRIGDNEFRLINDDSIDAVVDDPRGIKRV